MFPPEVLGFLSIILLFPNSSVIFDTILHVEQMDPEFQIHVN